MSGFDEGLVGRDLLGVSEQRDGQLDGDAFQRLLAQTRGPNGEVVGDEEQLFELLVGLEVIKVDTVNLRSEGSGRKSDSKGYLL